MKILLSVVGIASVLLLSTLAIPILAHDIPLLPFINDEDNAKSKVAQYDKEKNCATNQSYGNTNYITYLTHFSCGHVTVYSNGTTLRQFTLIAEDFHGSGKPIPISLNKTDPVMFPSWEFNGTVPGPTIRVTQGDHVKVTVINSKNSAFAHSLHFHSFHPGPMDGVMGVGGLIFPGTNFTYDFIAGPAGLYPYHCHMAPIQEHISRGLYGEFIIDPKVPRPHAVEMVMLMNAYTYSYSGYNGSGHFQDSVPGTAQQLRNNLTAVQESSDEGNGPDTQFYSVNGMPFGYTGHHMIHLFTNTPYRIYLLNMVEFDNVNSFHLHGTMFYYQESGTPQSARTYTDIVTLGQADRGTLEFSYPYAGEYMLHSHIAHFASLGWTGFFNVTRR
jgi:FtsP/CotA-like multicopper oxidase with cupredoxin domain